MSDYTVNHTVEHKTLREFNKTANTLDKLSWESSPIYRALAAYMEKYRVKSGGKEVNVTAPGSSYALTSDGAYEGMFVHLENCAKAKLVTSFRELQAGGNPTDLENKIGSGIMLDFDIVSGVSQSCKEIIQFSVLANRIFSVLQEMIEFTEEDTFYVAIITKPEPILKDIHKHTYKDGFHILIPSVQLARVQKKIFVEQLLKDQKLDKYFKARYGEEIGIQNVLDTHCSSVPAFFLHNAKEGVNVSYELHAVYKLSDENEYKSEEVNLSASSSWIKELSLTHRGNLITKKFYTFKGKFKTIAEERLKVTADPYQQEIEKCVETFNKEKICMEDNMDYYKTMVMDILSEERAYNRDSWRNCLYALANTGGTHLRPAMKEIARMFSMRCKSKYDTASFEKMWQDACSSRSNAKYTFNSLIYWAKMDNPKKFEEVRVRDIKHVIENDVFSRDGNKILDGALYEYHFAYYMYHLFGSKFVFDISPGEKEGKWYEFVTESDQHKKGEIYKWRCDRYPDSIMIYLSNRFERIISDVLNKGYEAIKTQEDANIKVFIEERLKKFRSSSSKLYTDGFKKAIVRQCEVLFRRRGFSDELDSCSNCMGVGNGVLKLEKDGSVELLSGFHELPVSKFTTVNYYPYDPEAPGVKRMWEILKGMFPESDYDAMHKLLYMFSTSLDGFPKDSEFYQLLGVGANGKSSLLELIKTILGLYGAKLSMSVLTEKRQQSSGANEQLMVLKDARLGFYSETNKSEVMNMAIAKELTSQESITARGIYQKQQTFRPNCLHVITTNHEMTIKTTDHGTWRRMNLYTMKHKFVRNPSKDDPFEKPIDESIAKEMAYREDLKEALMSILVEYWKSLQKDYGGNLSNVRSPTIERETAEYRYRQDILTRFICDNLVHSPGNTCTIQDIATSYERWVENSCGKSAVPERRESMSQISNSILVKRVKQTATKILIKDTRVLDEGDEQLSEGEEYLRDHMNIGVCTSDIQIDADTLKKMNPCNV